MNPKPKIRRFVLAVMFFVSGFSALLYQTVWLRLAFTEFGVITPVISIVISVFMLGLGIGSWLGGKYIETFKKLVHKSALVIYGLIEIFIGLGAYAVPKFFHYGAKVWTTVGETNSWIYLLSSAVVITISILPFAIAMGMTYPVVLEFFRECENDIPNKAPDRFSFLYTANTLGACLGALLPVFLFIEMFGFKKTLILGSLGNFFIAVVAIFWSAQIEKLSVRDAVTSENRSAKFIDNNWFGLIILFTTGFCSMAMELVWIRSFTPVLGTLVYSFAALLAVYLFSTWLGVFIYRYHQKHKTTIHPNYLLVLSALFASLPLLCSNPAYFKFFTFPVPAFFIALFSILLSIMPFSITLGYLSPLIIDTWSENDPSRVGKAYAINIMGCIIGPLFASYLILPFVGARVSLILLAVPLLVLALIANKANQTGWDKIIRIAGSVLTCIILFSSFFWLSWEEGAC